MNTIRQIVYSPLKTAILVLIVATLLGLLLKKVCKNQNIGTIVPTIFSVIILEVISCIKNNAFNLTVDGIYLGLIVGSISTAIIEAVKRIKATGKIDKESLTVLIESILSGYIKGKQSEQFIKSLISVIENSEATDIARDLASKIKEEQTLSDDKVIELVNKILLIVSKIK